MMLKFNNYVFNTGQIILRIKDNVLPPKELILSLMLLLKSCEVIFTKLVKIRGKEKSLKLYFF